MNKLLEYMPTELQYNPFAPSDEAVVDDPDEYSSGDNPFAPPDEAHCEDPDEYSGGESEPESIEDHRTKMLKNARASKVKKRKSV